MVGNQPHQLLIKGVNEVIEVIEVNEVIEVIEVNEVIEVIEVNEVIIKNAVDFSVVSVYFFFFFWKYFP